MLDFLVNADTEFMLLLNGFNNPWMDKFMLFVTGKFTWVIMYATILYIFFRGFRVKQAVILVIGVVLAIALADQICATVIRPMVCRFRPSNLDNPLSEFIYAIDGHRGGRYGFPSCHASNSFALVAFMSLLVRKMRFVVFIFAWAALNCYSRIYLGVHYPGDILCGGLIGFGCGALMYYVATWTAGLSQSHHHNKVLFSTQSKLLYPINNLDTVNIRLSDTFNAAGYATIFTVILLATLL